MCIEYTSSSLFHLFYQCLLWAIITIPLIFTIESIFHCHIIMRRDIERESVTLFSSCVVQKKIYCHISFLDTRFCLWFCGDFLFMQSSVRSTSFYLTIWAIFCVRGYLWGILYWDDPTRQQMRWCRERCCSLSCTFQVNYKTISGWTVQHLHFFYTG